MNSVLARLDDDPLALLQEVLLREPPADIGVDDFTHYPEMRPPHQTEAVEAAVLLALIGRPASEGGPALLFTRRTEILSRHSGQVSFPGGRRDASDLSPVETALRETKEETGIDAAFVTVAGYLPRYRTGSGFDILPVVGVLAEGFALVPDPHEVAEIFEVPLAFFLDPANRREESRELGGRRRHLYAYHPGSHYIWGATAAIVHNFVSRLTGAKLDAA